MVILASNLKLYLEKELFVPYLSLKLGEKKCQSFIRSFASYKYVTIIKRFNVSNETELIYDQ